MNEAMTMDADEIAAKAAALEAETGEPTKVVFRTTVSEFDEETPYDAKPREFKDLDEIDEANRVASEGVWRDFKSIPGCQVLICYDEELGYKLAERDRKWRMAKSKGGPLAANASAPIRLWIEWTKELSFGRNVKGWKGMRFGGAEQEFNESNFLRAMQTEQFANFVANEVQQLDRGRTFAMEADRKN